MSGTNDIMRECREILARGGSIEEVIGVLRSGGFSKVHSVKAIVDLNQASMSEAKRQVHHSTTWADVRERDEKFQAGLD